MSPSVRYLGTMARLNAILAHRAIYEIGGELDQRALIGRPPTHPPYVLLLFGALGRANRSLVRVETDLLDPRNWSFVRDGMLHTIRAYGLDLPDPGTEPPAWHHWRRFRDDHLVTEEGLAALKRLHLPRAARLANEVGLLLPNGTGSFTHPARERAVYGDGTIVRPIYAPPDAIRTVDDDGVITVLYRDPKNGHLLPTPPRRFDADIAEFHGHRGPVQGHGYVAFHARGRQPYQRVTLTIDHIPRPGAEAETAVQLVGDLHRVIGDGIQVVVYDGAFRGTHIDDVMTNQGYLVIAKLPEFTVESDIATLDAVKADHGTRVPSLPLGTVTHETPLGRCRHTLAAINGRPVEVDLDETGDPVIVASLERGPIKRSRRKAGRYHFNLGYSVACGHGSFSVWLSPHASAGGESRPEMLRALPDGDPDNLHIRGIRSDAEGNHSQFKRTLITERAMSLGWARGLVDYYCFALYSNAMTEAKGVGVGAPVAGRSG